MILHWIQLSFRQNKQTNKNKQANKTNPKNVVVSSLSRDKRYLDTTMSL